MLDEQLLDERPDFYIAHRQKETLDALKKGEIERVQVSQSLPVDKIAEFGLKEGFLQEGYRSFPDPRKSVEVPIDIILLSQTLQRLNDEHSLLLAPYMLNSADLVTRLGYNVKVISEGFNDCTYPRETAFHGETLKHILLSCNADSVVKWFNKKWRPIWQNNSPGRTRQYILDGTYILVPAHLVSKYEGAGTVKDEDGKVSHGYKVVFLYEIIDKKGVMVALKIAPIQDHDLKVGKELIKDFEFEKGSMLIMDRGFIDGEWITHLKKDLGVDVCMPLRRNMQITQGAISTADTHNSWQPHPTRERDKLFMKLVRRTYFGMSAKF